MNDESKSGSKFSKKDLLNTQSDYFAFKSSRSGNATKVKSSSCKSKQSKKSTSSQQKSNPYQLKELFLQKKNDKQIPIDQKDDIKIGAESQKVS